MDQIIQELNGFGIFSLDELDKKISEIKSEYEFQKNNTIKERRNDCRQT